MSESEQDGPVVADVQDERRGPERVVLRGVRAIVLDDLAPGMQDEVIAALRGIGLPGGITSEAWLPVALRAGQADKAIEAFAGKSGALACLPGTYKAIPAGSWFVSPQVIEPPLG